MIHNTIILFISPNYCISWVIIPSWYILRILSFSSDFPQKKSTFDECHAQFPSGPRFCPATLEPGWYRDGGMVGMLRMPRSRTYPLVNYFKSLEVNIAIEIY